VPIRILAAVKDPDTAMAVTTVVSEIPGAELGQIVADSPALLDALHAFEREAESPSYLLTGPVGVVLIDERIGDYGALMELIRQVSRTTRPSVGVVVLSTDHPRSLWGAATRAGAHAVLGPPFSYDRLTGGIQVAAERVRDDYRIHTAGTSIDWQTVTVTMALAPFVQALVSSFGTKLAGAIDSATRSALRRFVRRQGESARTAARSAKKVTLTLEGARRPGQGLRRHAGRSPWTTAGDRLRHA
jgi:hypothetical protein